MNRRYPWKINNFETNLFGRDFIAGDLHGEFEILEVVLSKLGFNYDIDRLFCVGDLIDRGPQSHRIVEFLNYDWFYSIAGNHEWMLYNCHADKKLSTSLWFPNGGDWWKHVSRTDKHDIVETVEENLSALITIETKDKCYGLVHALVYPFYCWSEFSQKIQNDQCLQQWALWERDFEALSGKTVAGVDMIFCGHTPIDQPLSFSNFFNIDTGCGHRASHWLTQPALTVVELSEELNFHRFATHI